MRGSALRPVPSLQSWGRFVTEWPAGSPCSSTPPLPGPREHRRPGRQPWRPTWSSSRGGRPTHQVGTARSRNTSAGRSPRTPASRRPPSSWRGSCSSVGTPWRWTRCFGRSRPTRSLWNRGSSFRSSSFAPGADGTSWGSSPPSAGSRPLHRSRRESGSTCCFSSRRRAGATRRSGSGTASRRGGTTPGPSSHGISSCCASTGSTGSRRSSSDSSGSARWPPLR